jgi:hypothetical protein
MAIYHPLYPGEDEWQENNICELCNHKAGPDESMRVLIFDALYKPYLCRHCLDRFIAAYCDDEEDDMEDEYGQ